MIHVADSSKKSPFRPLYRAFYPDPANKSVLRAEEANRFRAPGNRGWPLSVAPRTENWVCFRARSRLGSS